MKYLLLKALLSTALLFIINSGYSQEYIPLLTSDSILDQVFKGHIPIYDSNGNEIEPGAFYPRFTSDIEFMNNGDLLTDNIETFEYGQNNIGEKPEYSFILRYGYYPYYMSSFGFTHGLYIIKENKSNYYKCYEISDEYTYDSISGMHIAPQTYSFSIRKNGSSINRNKRLKNVINENYTINSTDSYQYQIIVNTKSIYWHNKSIKCNNNTIDMTACDKQYYINLRADYTFEQSFKTGVKLSGYPYDKEPKYGYPYMYTYSIDSAKKEKCNCFIEFDEGLWQVQDKNLVLYTISGIEMMRYEIIAMTKKELHLKIKNVDVILSR